MPRRLLSVLPPDCAKVTTEGWAPTPISLSQTGTPAETSQAHTPSLSQSQPSSQPQPFTHHLLPEEIAFSPTPAPAPAPAPPSTPSAVGGVTPAAGSTALKKRRGPKGWDGEIVSAAPYSHRRHLHLPMDGTAYDVFAPLRKVVTTLDEHDGSATSHVVVQCTLGDIARATNLRVEDAAFALSECGLLERMQIMRHQALVLPGELGGAASGGGGGAGGVEEAGGGETGSESGCRERVGVAITREMVEAVASERRVKPMCLSLAHVLL
ncbi:hypothetical protein ID866_11886 [Astraeus odoratus]|nr:hypothetical protein ID866_11886 [Astraeus odoratus]